LRSHVRGRSTHAKFVMRSNGRARLAALAALAAALAAALGAPSPAAATPLPDGRAWEIVSTPDKGNNDLETRETLLPERGVAGLDEQGMAYLSLNGLPGSEVGGLGNASIGKRGISGWATQFPGVPDINHGNGLVGTPLLLSADLNQALVASELDLTGGAPAQSNLFVRTLSPPSLRLVTALPAGEQLFWGAQSVVGAAGDFSRVYFKSTAGLTPDSSPGVQNLYEWDGAALRNVGILPGESAPAASGIAAVAGPTLHPVSADGSQVAFTAVPAGGGPAQLFLRRGGSTVEASAPNPGVTPAVPGEAHFAGAAADGSSVYFLSSAELTADANTAGGASLNLYRYDVAAGALTDLTVTAEATGPGFIDAEPERNHVVVSPDGSSAYFVATADLAPGATAGAENLYRWSVSGGLEFVADLVFGEGLTGFEPDPEAFTDRDGAAIAFGSSGALTGESPAGVPEVYRWAAGHGLACVSCRPGSSVTGARIQLPTVLGGAGGHPISEDGGKVFFSTGDRLVSADVNGRADAYEWEGGQARLISSGSGGSDSFFVDASPSGRDAFFTTRDRLLASDRDENVDVYDAREGGGFLEAPPPGAACEAEACRPPLAAAPAPAAAASRSFDGPGNARAKKHRHKKRHHKRRRHKKHGGRHGQDGHGKKHGGKRS
jgi:hypothetical protein